MFLKEYNLAAMAFCLSLLLSFWLLALVHIPIGYAQLIISAVATVGVLAVRACLFGAAGLRLSVVLAVLVILALSVAFSAGIFDTSWDGAAYHEVAIIALRNGWNPIYAPHLVPWWTEAFPDQAWLAATIADHGLWTDHYPKAAWVLGAVAVYATDNLNISKSPDLFLAVSAASSLYHGLSATDVPRKAAAPLALAAALSPVVIVQDGTNFVDGLLASAILIQLGAALAWVRARSAVDLFVLAAGFIIAANLKFTGGVYSAILLLGAAVLGLRRNWRLAPGERIAAACFVAGLVICSLQTYGLNLLEQGNPFYPINKIDVMAGNINHDFLARPRWEKAFVSLFSPPENTVDSIPSAGLFAPRLWHYHVITEIPDTRINGFGSLFGWSLLASAIGLLVCLAGQNARRRLKESGTALLVLLAAILAGVAANPEFWWARYAPQLWLVPILVSAVLFTTGRNRLAGLLLAPALAGSLLCLAFWARNTAATQHRVAIELARLANDGHANLLDGWLANQGVFAFAYDQRMNGVDVRLTDARTNCAERVSVGIVMVCHPAR